MNTSKVRTIFDNKWFSLFLEAPGVISPEEDGPIWVLTPKVGRPGYVEASDIQDAAPTAGLSQTVSLPVGSNWTGTKLVHRKGSKK